MNILVLGAFDKGALEHYFVHGLRLVEATVDTFDITRDYYRKIQSGIANKIINKLVPSVFFAPINSALLQFVQGRTYDVILVFKGLTLLPETLQELKRHTRLLCCYNPDHPFLFFSEGSGNKNILHAISLYDVYFTYASRITAELRKRYNINACTIPFGYDDSDASTAAWKGEAIGDKWLMIGAYDRERAAFITTLNDDGIAIYGDTKWKSRNKNNKLIQQCYRGRPLYGMEYKSAIHAGLGVFNILRRQNIEEGSHNMRTFEVPAYGGLLIANRTEEQLSFFEENKEAIYFSSTEELRDKLVWLRKHPTEVKKIKDAARSRSVACNYGYTHRVKELHRELCIHL